MEIKEFLNLILIFSVSLFSLTCKKQTTKVKEKGFVLMLKYCHHQGCGLFNVLELNLRTLETCSNIRMRLEGIVYLRQQMGLRDQFGSLGNHQQVGNKGYQATKSDPFE
jgi:hypothetical protein